MKDYKVKAKNVVRLKIYLDKKKLQQIKEKEQKQ